MKLPDAAVLHLARRATFGPTPDLLAEIESLGRDAWLRRQLSPSTIDDAVCDRLVARFPSATRSVAQTRADFPGGAWDPMYQLVRATLARTIWSRRQLFEQVVDLWSNHLNVTCPSNDVWDSRSDYDVRVIRPHALGRYADLLLAASTHPAMLSYLDNASSTKAHPNENQGRELLELHTVGLAAGYTEADVRDSARILTGLTIDPVTGLTVFRPDWHYVGPVRVLGFRHPNATAAGGAEVIRGYLRYLAGHAATAANLARKLAVRFVADNPPASLVSALTVTYLRSGTAIAPVLWQLFRSAEFAAPAVRMRKLRRPLDDLAATLRVLGIGPEPAGTGAIESLAWTASDLGQAPLGWAQPDGYPDVAIGWASAGGALARWTPHLNLAAGWWPNTLQNNGVRALLRGPLPATQAGVVDALAARLLFAPATAGHQAAVAALLGQSGPAPARDSRQASGRLAEVAALLLDSPEHVLR